MINKYEIDKKNAAQKTEKNGLIVFYSLKILQKLAGSNGKDVQCPSPSVFYLVHLVCQSWRLISNKSSNLCSPFMSQWVLRSIHSHYILVSFTSSHCKNRYIFRSKCWSTQCLVVSITVSLHSLHNSLLCITFGVALCTYLRNQYPPKSKSQIIIWVLYLRSDGH